MRLSTGANLAVIALLLVTILMVDNLRMVMEKSEPRFTGTVFRTPDGTVEVRQRVGDTDRETAVKYAGAVNAYAAEQRRIDEGSGG